MAISAADATRLIKSFRQAARITGEVKGNKLSPAQRTTFLGLLARQPDAIAAVTACSRGDPIGSWAMGALPEPELYRQLLAEACLALPGMSLARHIVITLDQPRYTKARVETGARRRGAGHRCLPSRRRGGRQVRRQH